MKAINNSSGRDGGIYRRNLVITIIAIAFFVGIILVYYSMLYSEKRTNIIKDGEVTAGKSADQIDKYISMNMDEVSLAAYTLDEMITKELSDEDIEDFLIRQSDAIRTAVDEKTTGIYGYINGRFFSGTRWIPPSDFDATQRPWYLKPISSPGEVTLLDPYLDMQSGQHMMAVGKALCDGESVVSMDMSFAGIQEIVDDAVNSGAADIGLVISDDNLVIAHSDRSEIGRDYDVQRGSLGEMIAHNLEDKEDYYFEFNYEGSNYIVYVSSIQSGLHCISVKNASKAFDSMKWVLIATIMVVIASIFVIGYFAGFYSDLSKNSDTVTKAGAEIREPFRVIDSAPAPKPKALSKEVTGFEPKRFKAADFFTQRNSHTKLGTRIQWLVFTVLLVSESLFCAASIIQSRAAIRSSVCQRMIDIANCAAGSVNGNIHKNLTADDVDSPEYMQVYNALAVYRDNVELEYVYALKIEDDGRFTYTVDPSVDEPEDFGDELEYTDGLYQASHGLSSVDDYRATDEWGTFYSSYSPIFDSSGNIAGIVGVDFSVDWFEGQLNQQTKSMVIIYLIILFVTIAFAWLLCFMWIRSITEPLSYMTEVAKRYGEGDFSEKIETGTGDEIGVLSHTLQVMSGSLQEQIYRAEEASRAKSTFLANMSHEIRTPINTVLGMNEMILRESGDNTILYYSQNIKRAGKSLLDLINDILDFSKIEAGKTEITPVEYNLAGLLNDLLVMMQSRAYDKGLGLNINFNPDIPSRLLGDEGRIRQIITNLLTNAVKYTKEGSITFDVSFKKDIRRPDSIYLLVKVSDTGMGIRREDMEKLFAKFERIDEKKNRNIEGTGLGLSITQSLLELMDSKLEVESEYEKGSVFSFELRQEVVSWEPMGDYKTFSENHSITSERNRVNFVAPSANILAVDDNPMNLVVFTNLIKHIHAKVDTAGSGQEGLDLSSQKKYDIIFLDHMMPEKDGIETLKELRASADNPNALTPAICLTANAISGAKEHYISEGFDSYLSKPIDPILLEKCLLTYLPERKVEISEASEDEGRAAAQTDEVDLLLEFRKQSILDVDLGLKNNGTAEAYLAIMQMYVGAADTKAQELDRLKEENDISNYTIQIHALKSSSRIIGAMELGEKAQMLENAGKSGDTDYISEHHEEFISDYMDLRSKLSAVLKEPDSRVLPEEEKHTADADMLNKVYNDIRSAADDMDIDRVEELLTEMDKYIIPENDKQLLQRIREAADSFDYSAIAGILDTSTEDK